MTSTTPTNRYSSDDTINTTPFLSSTSSVSRFQSSTSPSVRRRSFHGEARIRRRAASRITMREPSMLVRETVDEQLEEHLIDWAYSKPVVILGVICNFAFVTVAVGTLVLSRDEKPKMPLRQWIIGYALQCLWHIVCVFAEYRRRRWLQSMEYSPFNAAGDGVLSPGSGVESEQHVTLAQLEQDSGSNVAQHLESANTMFSFIWWITGFYCVSLGGQALARGSPQLYWLCTIFLGLDMYFVFFCVSLACIISIAVCCFLPCIIAILNAVADQNQKGASKEDIDKLSKFKFRKIGDDEKPAGDVQGPVGGIMIECGTDSPMEQELSQDDAECCICLSAYDDGVELRELPCGHHIHRACVDKWLYINATCPLCKYTILKS